MAKIDEVINNAKTELQDEMELIELDDKIKKFFKTKTSAFDSIKDWVVNMSDGIKVWYQFRAQGYSIFVTFKIIELKKDQVLKYLKVKVVDIERMK